MDIPGQEQDIEAIIHASIGYDEVFRKTAWRNKKELGLTNNQVDVLAILDIHGPLKMSELSDKMYVAREQATRTVKSLQDLGLVESVRSQENRKNVVASLTTKGKMRIEDHVKESHEILRSYLDKLTPEDREALILHSRAAADILKRNSFFPGSKH
ncbi:MAG: MarR family winged helix-turn-helix transcriptional regulator [Raoultibacter sp.]